MRISIRLDEQDSAALKRQVEASGRSASDLVRQALQQQCRTDSPEEQPAQGTEGTEGAKPESSALAKAPAPSPEAQAPPRPHPPAPFDHGVGVRILSVPLDPVTGLYDDGPLQRFLADKRLLRLEPVFVAQPGTPHWSVWVQYLPTLSPAEGRLSPQSPPLGEEQQRLLGQLKQWRKQRAAQEGVPVYVVATNRQLEDLVRHQPHSLAALQQIRGFGGKKTQRYGEEILIVLQPAGP